MLRRYCVALLSLVAVAPASSALTAAGHSDYVLDLQPPENTAHDVEVALAAIVEAEREKRQLSDSEFETAKQSMINVEKQRLRDIVRNSLGAVA